MHAIITSAVATFIAAACLADEPIGVHVVDSGSQEVDDLVAQLVSFRPAPLPNGAKPSEHMEGIGFLSPILMSRYATDRVEHAIGSLMSLQPSSFPFLLKHLEDDRYCFSVFIGDLGPEGVWWNYDVGAAVQLVLSNEFNGPGGLGGYKFREGKDGQSHSWLSFSAFLEARGGMKEWVNAVSGETRVEAYTAFIDWCVEEEKKRGFRSIESRTLILGRYAKARDKVEQGGAGQSVTRPDSDSEGGDKPKTESEERSQ